jgi:hypothetical protein
LSRIGLVIGLFIAAFAALLIYSTFNGARKYRVEVCMVFDGRSRCKTVNAKNEAAALRSATENACADIASGVDETIRCQNTQPKTVRWLTRPE